MKYVYLNTKETVMFKHKDIITAIEIGGSKICVLLGEVSDGAPFEVIGQSEVPLDNEVIKGEITDMDRALEKFIHALEIADSSSGGELNNSVITAISVTGCNISSYQASAMGFIKSSEGRISDLDINEAVAVIEKKPLATNQEKLNIIDSYYLLDGVRRVRNPFEQNAHKFELFCHVIYGDSNRINNFRSIFMDAGFEEQPNLIFSALADLYGIASAEEREHGALLVDIGRGTTEYIAIFNDGVFASGVILVGFDHVANDLAIGLDLPLDVCRNIISANALQQYSAGGSGIVDLVAGGTRRRIPLVSFEKIIDLRLRELFGIIKSNFHDRELLRNLACGGILTGGGALYPRTSELFNSVFEFPVRVGYPYDHSRDLGALADPRYSTLWGTLCYAAEQLKMLNTGRNRGLMGALSDAVGTMGDSAWRTLAGLKNSIKI